MVKVLGVDEAGRGPVIGSMFVGGFLVDKDKLDEVENLGVKDSKKLSNKLRDSIDEVLEDYGDTFLKEVEAEEIDELREIMSLNEIELHAFVDIIERAEPDEVFVDLPEPDGDRFIRKMKRELPERFQDVKFVAEHEADDTYPVVSAASIVAKSARERHTQELKEKYGYDFKSGYPHDKPTINFLEKFVEEKGELPKETRKSWSTAERVLKEADQKGLGDFN